MTNDERQNQIDLIFLAALDVPLDERQAFLQEHFDHVEPDVLREVEELLSMDEGATDAYLTANPHLKLGQVLDSTEASVTEDVGSVIGKYHLLQKLGEGGMGVVYMAEQREPVKRRVALKVIKPGMNSKSVVARFEAERQALAMMDHPNIAKVLDAGMTDSGLPYFVMELVKGTPITTYCDENKLTVDERLALFESVCQAVHHAHQKGVIHRDLKPSNILVADYDDIPATKVIDFGLAKALQQSLTEKTLFTQFGQIVGTYEYMSPEQAKLNQLDIDTRTDIYSLGVLLYELLSGQTPFDAQTLRGKALDEMLRIIREDDPPKPSIKLTSSPKSAVTSVNRKTAPQRLRTKLSGDLDAVVMKSLSKERSRRYESSSEFAKDIRRYLDGRPVLAQPPSAFYVGWKILKRHRVIATATALILLSILIGSASTSFFAYLTSVAYKNEQDIRRVAERGKYVANIHAVSELLASSASTGVRDVLDDAPKDLRGWEWDYLDGVFAELQSINSETHNTFIQGLACSPNGDWFATIDFDGQLRVWNAESRSLERTINLPEVGAVSESTRLWASPSNKHILLSGAAKFHIVDVANGDFQEIELPHEFRSGEGRRRYYVTFSQPHGQQIMFSRSDLSTFFLYDVDGRTVEQGDAPQGMTGSRFTPWPNRILSSGRHPDGELEGQEGYFMLWDQLDQSPVKEIRLRPKSPESSIELRFGRTGKTYISYPADEFGDITVWDFGTGEDLWRIDLTSHGIGNYSESNFDFSPDDSQFVIPLALSGLLICDIPSQETTVLRGHENSSRGVAYRSNQEIVSSDLDRRICFWEAAHPPAFYDWPVHASQASCVFNPNGDKLATIGRDRTIKLWKFPEMRLRKVFQWHQLWFEIPRLGSFSQNGELLAVGSASSLRIWDTSTGALRGPTKYFKHGSISGLHFAPDGKSLFVVLSDGACQKVDVDASQGIQVAQFDEHPFCFDVSRSGNWIVAAGLSGKIELADVKTGKTQRLGDHRISINSVCFDDSEQRVACSGYDRKVTVYDLQSGLEIKLGDRQRISPCAFLPSDKKRLFASTFKSLRLWDLDERSPVLTFHSGDSRWFTGFAVHPSEEILCASLDNGSIRCWHRNRPSPDDVRSRRLRKHAQLWVERRLRQSGSAIEIEEIMDAAGPNAEARREASEYLAIRLDVMNDIVEQVKRVVLDPTHDDATYLDALAKAQMLFNRIPDAPQCTSLLGMTQFRAGKNQDAIETLQQASVQLEQIPEMPRIRYTPWMSVLRVRAKNFAFLALALAKGGQAAKALSAIAEMEQCREECGTFYQNGSLDKEVAELKSTLNTEN